MGVAGVKQLFAEQTEYVKKLGHKGLHSHVTDFSCGNMKEEGYSTVWSYNPMDWIAGRFLPEEIELPDYGTVAADVAFKLWDEHHAQFDIPYIPALAPGWDFTLRYIAPQGRPEKPNRSQWPACTIFKNEDPASFLYSLRLYT